MRRRSTASYFLGLVFTGLLAFSPPVFAQTNQGTDFWLAETTNTINGNSDSLFAIAIANPNGATANVTIAHFGDADLLDTVPAGGLKTFTFPRRAVCTNAGSNLGKDMVYHVTSDLDVVVYIFNPIDTIFTNDASLALPVPALGKIHRTGSYVNPNGNTRGSFVSVVAVADGTLVQVFDSSNTLVGSDTIDQGEYYQYVSGDCFGGNDAVSTDTTGWHVVTSVPAAVYSGSQCTSLGNSTGACDHLEEQVLPEEAVAATYVACPTLTRPVGCDHTIPGSCSPDVFRYVATVANTTVSTSPNVGGTVLANAGDFLEITTSSPHVVTADQPIYGYQYLISQDSGPPPAGTGDPSMLDMPPVDQLQFNYIFLTPNTYAFDFINVVAPVGTGLTLDGNAVAEPCAPVGSIAGVDYCCLRTQVSDGVHTISGTNRFGLSVSGFDSYASYAYIGGVGLQPINAGCNTGGPYQTSTCSLPVNVQLTGTPSCSDESSPTIEWSSIDGVTFDDATIADPLATVSQFGSSQVCMKVTCPSADPVSCCSTINVQNDCVGPTPTGVPTVVPTATPTISPTPTPTPELDHFQCYEAHAPNRNISGITLVDAFGPSTVRLITAHRLCAPANKNDENGTAQLHPVHLDGYRMRQTSPKPPRGLRVTVDNQFGAVDLKVIRPDYLLLPASKSLTVDPAPPLAGPPTVDHFKCYRVQGRQRVENLTVEDQFATQTVSVKRPQRLCLAANKNGEGLVNPSAALMCYEMRLMSSAAFSAPGKVFVDTQLGAETLNLFRRTELCVPSTLRGTGPSPIPTATPIPTVTTVSTQTAVAPTPTETPAETATPPETATPEETATPVETETPVATDTPVETETPVETATPDPTPTETPE